MTPKETTALISLIRSTFPRSQFGPDAAEAMSDALRPLPFEAVRATVIAHARSSVFAPAIAEVWEPVRNAALGLPSPELAWSEVVRRVRSTTPGQPNAPAWEVPPLLRLALRDVGGTYAVRTTDNESRLRDRFIKAYRQLRDAEIRALDDALAAGAITIERDATGGLRLVALSHEPALLQLS